MTSKKFQVFIAAEESTDKKTTVVNLKRIRIYDEDVWYHIPEDFQKVSAYHSALAAMGPVKSALNAIKNRGQYRSVKVTVSQVIADTYLDKDENFEFGGVMLEEVVVGTESHPPDPKMAELALCLQRFKPPESVKDILEHFLVEKFSPKNRNVKAWCELFEKESSRFSLTECKRRASSKKERPTLSTEVLCINSSSTPDSLDAAYLNQCDPSFQTVMSINMALREPLGLMDGNLRPAI
ncbi:hypothetical protein GE061_015514 [Apolygus lucorum]|uniref:Uncharacterized protein n=1 Tax=Apolygus lucorum TaxID=248454 RepID=A0A8S9XMD5_APOLU|nr:hypothetical protein GE061_015514 [Apolygus lucorum]